MDNIGFNMSICTNATAMFEAATSPDEHLDVVDEVISSIEQGDPIWDDICEKVEELFGEEAAEPLDEVDLKEYISYTGGWEIDYDEMAAGGDPALLVYRVSCEFDVGKFAEKYGLEPIGEEQEK